MSFAPPVNRSFPHCFPRRCPVSETRVESDGIAGDGLARRPAEDEEAARALAAARAALVLSRDAKGAFFATLALRLTPVVDRSVGTMATDGHRLLYHPDFVLTLSKEERVGVLVHEVMHCALAHFARRAGRDLTRWNVACDLAVNPILLDAGFQLPSGRLVPGEARFAHLPPGKSAEEYYAILPVPAGPDGSEDPDSPINKEEASSDPGGCGGVIEPPDGSPAIAREAEAVWRAAVAQAETAARGRGDLPAGLGRVVEEVIHPPADWRTLLRTFVSRHARHDYSWTHPNRRFVAQGLFLPGLRSEELGEVVIAVDTSGSVGPRELGLFAAEIEALLGAFDCTAAVLYHDTQVQKVETWTATDGPLVLTPIGGGGTDHRCVFDWVAAAAFDPAVVVCLTDLDTRFPDHPPAVPVLWAQVGSTRIDPPFGTVVPIGP
jgi:predicted metal-dependent peptidase